MHNIESFPEFSTQVGEEKWIPIWEGSDEYRILHVIRSFNMFFCTRHRIQKISVSLY